MQRPINSAVIVDSYSEESMIWLAFLSTGMVMLEK